MNNSQARNLIEKLPPQVNFQKKTMIFPIHNYFFFIAL